MCAGAGRREQPALAPGVVPTEQRGAVGTSRITVRTQERSGPKHDVLILKRLAELRERDF